MTNQPRNRKERNDNRNLLTVALVLLKSLQVADMVLGMVGEILISAKFARGNRDLEAKTVDFGLKKQGFVSLR